MLPEELVDGLGAQLAHTVHADYTLQPASVATQRSDLEDECVRSQHPSHTLSIGRVNGSSLAAQRPDGVRLHQLRQPDELKLASNLPPLQPADRVDLIKLDRDLPLRAPPVRHLLGEMPVRHPVEADARHAGAAVLAHCVGMWQDADASKCHRLVGAPIRAKDVGAPLQNLRVPVTPMRFGFEAPHLALPQLTEVGLLRWHAALHQLPELRGPL
mmetsp:Transcript_71573/g.159158  ORF Transcript_71573/g.159158 Transcript_71573/m.159158 type:complete len:214 (+) Transcript_71573:2430-3071(+)